MSYISKTEGMDAASLLAVSLFRVYAILTTREQIRNTDPVDFLVKRYLCRPLCQYGKPDLFAGGD